MAEISPSIRRVARSFGVKDSVARPDVECFAENRARWRRWKNEDDFARMFARQTVSARARVGAFLDAGLIVPDDNGGYVPVTSDQDIEADLGQVLEDLEFRREDSRRTSNDLNARRRREREVNGRQTESATVNSGQDASTQTAHGESAVNAEGLGSHAHAIPRDTGAGARSSSSPSPSSDEFPIVSDLHPPPPSESDRRLRAVLRIARQAPFRWTLFEDDVQPWVVAGLGPSEFARAMKRAIRYQAKNWAYLEACLETVADEMAGRTVQHDVEESAPAASQSDPETEPLRIQDWLARAAGSAS